MSKLLGMSFDVAASPLITLLYTREARLERKRPFGWGVGWYAGDDRAVTLVKDPDAASESASTQLLRDWTRFRSTTFVCHLRGAAARISQENTHPFSRSHAGRDWVMTHHGQLGPGFEQHLPLGERPVFEPIGRTDTERVLCWLLQKCRDADVRRLSEVGWSQLRALLAEVNQLGSLNLLIADGFHLVAYQCQTGHAPLQWIRRRPPFEVTTISNNDLELDLGSVRDRTRTSVLVTSDPLSEDAGQATGWTQMTPGQMLVISRGAIVWDSSVAGKPTSAPPAAPQMANPTWVERSGAGGVVPNDVPVATQMVGAMQLGEGSVPADPAGAQPAAPAVRSAMPEMSRTYDITHSTIYTYGTPVEFSRHLLRLRPVHDRFQEVLSYELSIVPLTAQHEHEDVFGNGAARIEIEGVFPEISFTARSRVRIHGAPAGELRTPHRRTTIPLSWMPWQRQMMLPYLLPMELPEPQLQELFDYAMGFVERQDYDLVEALLDINTSIYRDYAYVQGVTSVETTPFEVYTTRRGVCQDFANLLICLARLLNVPARYRVGYIYTGGNYENKVQSDASHAWVEVFLPWIGWKGLDPTNGCVVNLDHVRIACGRHYRDATPTSGTIYRGGGDEKLAIEVRVEPVVDGNG